MKVFVVGASGATGRLLLNELLRAENDVIAVVRNAESLPESLRKHPRLSVVIGSPLTVSEEELKTHLYDCDAVASCLGHNLTFKGIFGQPRRLVTEATARICRIIAGRDSPSKVKFLLMNTAGNRNRDLQENVSFGEKVVVGIIRLLVPPHSDNEQAADFLRTEIGTNHPKIEWVVIRPDTLINHDETSEYTIHPSPTRSAIFNPGKTSRINVAHFMVQLILNETDWEKWKGQMPVIYNGEMDG